MALFSCLLVVSTHCDICFFVLVLLLFQVNSLFSCCLSISPVGLLKDVSSVFNCFAFNSYQSYSLFVPLHHVLLKTSHLTQSLHLYRNANILQLSLKTSCWYFCNFVLIVCLRAVTTLLWQSVWTLGLLIGPPRSNQKQLHWGFVI